MTEGTLMADISIGQDTELSFEVLKKRKASSFIGDCVTTWISHYPILFCSFKVFCVLFCLEVRSPQHVCASVFVRTCVRTCAALVCQNRFPWKCCRNPAAFPLTALISKWTPGGYLSCLGITSQSKLFPLIWLAVSAFGQWSMAFFLLSC